MKIRWVLMNVIFITFDDEGRKRKVIALFFVRDIYNISNAVFAWD